MNTPSKPGFRIVLLPGLSPGTSREQVLDTLAARFGVSREKAESFLSDKPLVLKKGLNQQQALNYQQALNDCGLNCRLDWIEGATPVESPSRSEPAEYQSTAALPCCPNCGYRAANRNDPLIKAFDGMGQCPACNIIVAKYGKPPDNLTSSENEGMPAGDQSAAGPTNPAADIPFVSARLNTSAGGLVGGKGKILGLSLAALTAFFVGYLIVKSDSSPGPAVNPAGHHFARQQYAAEAARMAEDPTYVSPMVENGPPPGYGNADAVAQKQRDRIEALDLSDRQLPPSWFDAADVRIEPGEVWEGNIDIKLPFETAYLTIPPDRGGKSAGDFMYKDMDLGVGQNPWQTKGVRVAVTGQWVSGYDFRIWVMAENGRVTGVLYPQDRALTLEALGRLSTQELREIEWSSKSNLPPDFDPVFDLIQGWGHGHKVTVGLSIEVPVSLADYRLGQFVDSHAETVYLENREEGHGEKMALTLAKKKGDPALYFRPGKFL